MFLFLFLSFAFAFICSRWILHWIFRYSFRNRLFDAGNERTLCHGGAVPRLGGVAFFPAMFFSILLVMLWRFAVDDASLDIFLQRLPHSLFLIAASAVCIVYGVMDDRYGLDYKWKLLLQGLMAILVLFSGYRIDGMLGLMGIHELSMTLSLLVTMFGVMFLINALNFIDGIDGLAAGLVMLALFYYGFLFYLSNRTTDLYSIVAMLGAIVPFAYYNMIGYKKKHRIFMGDVGSASLGLFIAWICLQLYADFPHNMIATPSSKFFVLLAPIVVPCCDVVRVIICRLLGGRNPFRADSNHIHHKLIRAGFSPKQTLFLILLYSLCCMAAVLLLRNQDMYRVIFIILFIFLAVDVLLTFYLRRKTRMECEKGMEE